MGGQAQTSFHFFLLKSFMIAYLANLKVKLFERSKTEWDFDTD